MSTLATTTEELRWFTEAARAPRLRTLREFAEAEIIIPPGGAYSGRRFRCERQPYTALVFAALEEAERRHWWRRFFTGPTQSGKTLTCFVIVLLYHLFEICETVIVGLPDMNMANDKWREDILPVIEQTRYASQLPVRGEGSRGGSVKNAIQFRHGPTLKFMSGGGSDKKRAGFTARVVIITETDGLDTPGETSREADKISQLVARTRSFGSRARVYAECTVSVEEGRTWKEIKAGTDTRVMLPCPHCQAWVSPEREDFTNWRQAETVVEAQRAGHFQCPECEQPWSEADRRLANANCQMLHAGQKMRAGKIIGKPIQTDTLGFRWSAINNLFVPQSDIAADEWRASRDPDEENADLDLRQTVWAIPAKPSERDVSAINMATLSHRTGGATRGTCPPALEYLTVGVDLGLRVAHYVAVAWLERATSAVIDYGVFEIASDALGPERAFAVALREFRDMCEAGWRYGEQTRSPDAVWIDSGYQGPDADVFPVYDFCREAGQVYRPIKGFGGSQYSGKTYHSPRKRSADNPHIGEGYHLARLRRHQIVLVEVDADYWKSWAHHRLSCPSKASGAMTLYDAPSKEHLQFARHLTAETQIEEYVAGRGVVTRWHRNRPANHWFDALYVACAAGHYVGARLLQEETQAVQAGPRPKPRPALMMPDGRPYLITER